MYDDDADVASETIRPLVNLSHVEPLIYSVAVTFRGSVAAYDNS